MALTYVHSDLGYGRGDEDVWTTWHGLIEPVSSRLPYHVTIGNHEYSYKGLPGTNDPSGAGQQWAPPFSNVYNGVLLGGNDLCVMRAWAL